MPIRIVYASQSSPGIGHDDIDKVVRFSHAWNADHDVTGVIAFDGRQIMQIIEGPQQVVEDLYGRIRLDHRHSGVVTLGHGDIAKPHFPQWRMVHRPLSELLMLVEQLLDQP